MANAYWKRIETSPAYRRRKRFFKRLLGRELRLKPEVDVPLIHAGDWRYSPTGLDAGSIAYSLGVGDDIGLVLLLIEKHGVELHAFDPTPNSLEMLDDRELPPKFHMHPWGVCASDGPIRFAPRAKRDGSSSEVMYTIVTDAAADAGVIEVPGYTLATIASTLGHERIDLLKMDIEGAEYEVLDGMLDSALRPRQLLVEFHHRFPGIGLERTATMIERLRGVGYRISAVSDLGREVSFLLT